LACGVSGQTAFLAAAAVLALGAAAGTLGPRALRYAPMAACVIALATGLGESWARHNDVARWGRLLPVETYRGSFSTAQGVYLYGERESQFIVVSSGGVSDSLPGEEHAAEVAALHLAQKPDAKRAVVIGSGGLGICNALLTLPQIENATWLHPDPEYPSALLRILPEHFRTPSKRLAIPTVEVRSFLRATSSRFDLVLINLPDVTTLVLNRYCTEEFFTLVKGALAKNGVVSVRISGAANYVTGEMAYLGSSMLTTLESAFAHVILKPGDESWLMASDGEDLSTFARGLSGRFSSIEGAAALYPPENIPALFPADRVAFQMEAYRHVAETPGEAVLFNSDAHPKALLYSLLLALRRAGWRSLVDDLPIVLHAGLWILMCPVVLYVALRFVYLLRGRGRDRHASPFDGAYLVFSTGLAGMALSIVLMFLYQERFGALFLHVGLIAALYMLGSFAGSLFVERTLARSAREPWWLLPVSIIALLALIALVAGFPEIPGRAAFGCLFLACGVCIGACFPIAAHRMQAAGRPVSPSGSNLEMADHVGGALGGVATGLILLPLFGVTATLAFLAVMAASNLMHGAVRGAAAPAGDWFDRLTRPAGYAMAGIGIWFLIASNVVAMAQRGRIEGRILAAAKNLTGGAELKSRQAALKDGGAFFYYEVLSAAGETEGYVWNTAALAKDVRGYGGPITLAVYVDREGVLRDFRIVESHETPVYLDRLALWPRQLPGRNLFAASPFSGVDAVSGATMTSEALLKTLELSGRQFAAGALGQQLHGMSTASERGVPDRDFLCLSILMAAAVVLRYHPQVWIRRAMLLTALIATGFLWNLQYSSQQVMALLSGHFLGLGLSGALFLAAGTPLIVVLFGNVYCGYVCPFGALQELLGDLRPRFQVPEPKKIVWRYCRAAKYGLLLLVIVLFSVTRDYVVLGADPLITVFSAVRSQTTLWSAALLLLLTLRFRRFWCRNLCPAGAFLALLGGARLLRRWTPRTQPARCDLGVRTVDDLDCIHCDRCRHENGKG
jgi:spermidine synthase